MDIMLDLRLPEHPPAPSRGYGLVYAACAVGPVRRSFSEAGHILSVAFNPNGIPVPSGTACDLVYAITTKVRCSECFYGYHARLKPARTPPSPLKGVRVVGRGYGVWAKGYGVRAKGVRIMVKIYSHSFFKLSTGLICMALHS
jgi:hypothetical protein